MNKTIRLAFALCVVAGMMATTFRSPVSAASKKTIAIVLSGPDLYYKYGADGAAQAAKALGYNYKIYTNPTVSPTVEASNIRAAVSAHSAAITGYSVGLTTEDASLSYAKAHHVPIFFMYGYAHKYLTNKDVVGFEQVNLVAYAKATGAYTKAHFKGELGIITGQLGRGDAEGYQQGFLEGLGCSNPGTTTKMATLPEKCGSVTVDESQSGGWLRPQANAKASAMLTAWPNMKGMFVENDDMAYGVHTAAVSAGRSLFFVSDNGAPYGLDAIAGRNGQSEWLAADDTCSPALEGINSVRLINGFLHGKVKPDKLYYSYKVFVTKSNIGKAVGWDIAETHNGKLINAKAFKAAMKSALPKPVKNPPM